MDTREILKAFQTGKISLNDAQKILQGYENLGFAKIDLDRPRRNGYPEIIYGEGKKKEQIAAIINHLDQGTTPILTTRIDNYKAKFLQNQFPGGKYFADAHCFVLNPLEIQISGDYIAVVCAGTSDLSVAEEAAIVAEQMGNHVERVYDVGVAGIHRLFNNLEKITQAKVVIVIAGMEGALASVVGGLVDVPVIAVPTSVGYGSSFNGITALLGMLNACASGVTVVNIDNGFGAAYSASMINKM